MFTYEQLGEESRVCEKITGEFVVFILSPLSPKVYVNLFRTPITHRVCNGCPTSSSSIVSLGYSLINVKQHVKLPQREKRIESENFQHVKYLSQKTGCDAGVPCDCSCWCIKAQRVSGRIAADEKDGRKTWRQLEGTASKISRIYKRRRHHETPRRPSRDNTTGSYARSFLALRSRLQKPQQEPYFVMSVSVTTRLPRSGKLRVYTTTAHTRRP